MYVTSSPQVLIRQYCVFNVMLYQLLLMIGYDVGWAHLLFYRFCRSLLSRWLFPRKGNSNVSISRILFDHLLCLSRPIPLCLYSHKLSPPYYTITPYCGIATPYCGITTPYCGILVCLCWEDSVGECSVLHIIFFFMKRKIWSYRMNAAIGFWNRNFKINQYY